MLFTLGDNMADVDVEATKKLYTERIEAYRLCYCSSCRNYQERIRRISPTAARFFASLGVVPDKAEEVWAYLPGKAPFTQQYSCVFPLVCNSAQINSHQSYTEIEEGLLAGFELIEGEAVLVVDWTLRWVHP